MIDKNQISTVAQEDGRNLRFLFLISGSILVGLLLVAAALSLYITSGAEQLDLSRPSYAELREQATKSDEFKGFSNTGSLNKSALEEFEKLYNERVEDVTSVDAFGQDVLSTESLQIDQKSAEASAQATAP